MNLDNSTSEKQIVLLLSMKTNSIDFDKIDNLKFNQVYEDFYTDSQTLFKDYEVEKYTRIRDGIVITWHLSKGIKNLHCLRLPIVFQQLINTKSNYYHSRYGLTPKMCAVEKIYEFEEVNSAWKEKSHLQKIISELNSLSNVSNTSNKQFLVSGELITLCEADEYFKKMSIKYIEIPVEDLPFSIFSVETK